MDIKNANGKKPAFIASVFMILTHLGELVTHTKCQFYRLIEMGGLFLNVLCCIHAERIK
jgi:hypothetical protein